MIPGSENHPESTALALVEFKAGRFDFAIEASGVRGSEALPDYDIPEIETLLSLSEVNNRAARLCLSLESGGQIHKISVAAPIALFSLPAAAIQPLPPALKARCRLPGLRALALTKEKFILLISLQDLLLRCKTAWSQ